MMATKKYIYFFAILLLAVAVWVGSPELMPSRISEAPSEGVPSFQLPDLNDELRSQNDWAGKVVILNFWAVWCPPCRAEMPEFIELQEQYGDQGLQFVGIAIDTKETVQDFSKKIGVNYPILIGTTNDMSIARKLGNRFDGLPFTAIFNREGKMAYFQIGQISKSRIEKEISSLL